MGDSYNPGYKQGYSFTADDKSLGNNMIESNCYNSLSQQASVDQDTLLHGTRSRHDSVNSHLSPHLSRYIAGQHQAENQPCAVQSTPHTSDVYPYRSETMSRATSHASHLSSASSGQPYGGSPHFVPHHPYPNIWPPNRINMQRSQSALSNTSLLQSQQLNSQLNVSQKHQAYTDSYRPDPMDMFSTDLSNTTHYSPLNTHPDDSVIEYPSNNTTDMSVLDYGTGAFGQLTGQSNYLTALTQIRPRSMSDVHPLHRPTPNTLVSNPHIEMLSGLALSSRSTVSQSPQPVEQSKHRRGASTSPSDSESELITGHVLGSGKFKCSDIKCAGLSFGRLADFKRHRDNTHNLRKKEYFCTVAGCERSKVPLKKSKGRSFGGRKDKMEEHVQTVHQKESKKRGRSPRTEIEDGYDDKEEEEEPQTKAQRLF